MSTCLWFDRNGEEAARFYTSIFKNSKIGRIAKYGKNSSGRPEGTFMTVEFELDGRPFLVLNGGPIFKFNNDIRWWSTATRRSRSTRSGKCCRPAAASPSNAAGWIEELDRRVVSRADVGD